MNAYDVNVLVGSTLQWLDIDAHSYGEAEDKALAAFPSGVVLQIRLDIRATQERMARLPAVSA